MTGLKRWSAALAVGMLGLVGLFGAARSGSGGEYVTGLLLFVAAVVVVMGLVKQHFDGTPEDRLFDIWPSAPRDNWVVLVALAALGLVGLFLAASDPGVYRVGLCLTAAAIGFGGYTLKRIYDLRDAAAATHDGAGGSGHAA